MEESNILFKVLMDPIGYKNDISFIGIISKNPLVRVYPSFINGIKDHAHIAHFNWLEYDTQKKFIRFLVKVIIYKILNLKVLFTVHNVVEHIHNKYTLTYLQYKIMIKVSNHFMFFSENDRKIFEKLYNVNVSKKYTVVHHSPVRCNIVKTSKEQARKELKLDPNDIIIISYGAIFRYKGVDDLIDFIAKLKDTIPNRNIFFILFGKCREKGLEAELKEKLKKIDYYIWNKEFIPDEVLSKYITAADINAMTFKEISNSLTFLLGKRFPTKIFAPYTGSLPEHDHYGFPSYFYRKRNFESMKKIFLKAIEDPPYPTEFISDEEVFREEKRMVKEVLKIYQHLLS